MSDYLDSLIRHHDKKIRDQKLKSKITNTNSLDAFTIAKI